MVQQVFKIYQVRNYLITYFKKESASRDDERFLFL